MKIYLSAPINGHSNHQDVFNFLADQVIEAGHEPVNPLDIACQCDGCQTPLPGKDHSWECFMRWDLIEMLKCDAVVFAPTWRTSHGCRLEHTVAIMTGIQTLEVWQLSYHAKVKEAK